MYSQANYLTLRQAAERCGLSPDTLRWQIRNGKLAATKLGRDWFVAPAEVERYQRENLRKQNETPRP